jgi:hypothetical protein
VGNPFPLKKSATSAGMYAPGQVHYNRPLTNFAADFISGHVNNPGFVSDRVFPTLNVDKQSDVYWVINDEHLRDDAEMRAPGTESAGGTMKTSQDTYYAPVWARHTDIPDQMRSNADQIFQLDRAATQTVMHNLALRRERSWITAFFNAAAWTFHVDGNATATALGSFDPTGDANNQVLFWDAANSTPIEDIRRGQRYVGEKMGGSFRPNTLVLARGVYDVLVDHPDIVGRLDRGQTPNGPARATREALAAIFELDQVLVMDAVYNASKQGSDNTFVAANGALLTYTTPTPNPMLPTAGYTFMWSGYTGVANGGIAVKKFRMEELASDRIEGEIAFAHKVLSPHLGYFFDDIVDNP